MNLTLTLESEEGQQFEVVFDNVTPDDIAGMKLHIAAEGGFIPLEKEGGDPFRARVLSFRDEAVQ